jgi:lysyl-tRNA synthetase, class I
VAGSRTEADWVCRLPDEVLAEVELCAGGRLIFVASGLSPSGPIHLGNLREVMTSHFVADEVWRRGIACEHVISCDDFDRFRGVPLGVDGVDPDSRAQHIGKPLTSVPAPDGSPHPNWAEHFKAPMVEALDRLGLIYRGISQTEMYASGTVGSERVRAVIGGTEPTDPAAADDLSMPGRPDVTC